MINSKEAIKIESKYDSSRISLLSSRHKKKKSIDYLTSEQLQVQIDKSFNINKCFKLKHLANTINLDSIDEKKTSRYLKGTISSQYSPRNLCQDESI